MDNNFDLDCPDCNSKKVTTSIEEGIYPFLNKYSGNIEDIKYDIFIRECHDCTFKWTDFATEDSQEEAINAHFDNLIGLI